MPLALLLYRRAAHTHAGAESTRTHMPTPHTMCRSYCSGCPAPASASARAATATPLQIFGGITGVAGATKLSCSTICKLSAGADESMPIDTARAHTRGVHFSRGGASGAPGRTHQQGGNRSACVATKDNVCTLWQRWRRTARTRVSSLKRLLCGWLDCTYEAHCCCVQPISHAAATAERRPPSVARAHACALALPPHYRLPLQQSPGVMRKARATTALQRRCRQLLVPPSPDICCSGATYSRASTLSCHNHGITHRCR
jgi:hypothetical protein